MSKLAIACGTLVLAFAVPAHADHDFFCDGLQRVLADAPNGFKNIRAEKIDDNGDFKTSVALAPVQELDMGGETGCEVDSDYHSTPGPFYYCSFAVMAKDSNYNVFTAGPIATNLADRVRSCVGQPTGGSFDHSVVVQVPGAQIMIRKPGPMPAVIDLVIGANLHGWATSAH